MRKHFFVNKIVLYMGLLMTLLVSLLALYAYSSLTLLSNEIRQESANFLQLCGSELKSRVTRMDSVLHDLLLQNQRDLQLLDSPSESKRFYALQGIKNYISNILKSDPVVSCIVVADTHYGLSVDAEVASVGFWDRTALREYTMGQAAAGAADRTWRFETINGRNYLHNLFVYDGQAVAVYTSTSDFLATIPKADYGERVFLLTDALGTVQDFLGQDMAVDVLGRTVEELSHPGTLMVGYEVASEQIYLHHLVHNVVVWNQARISMLAAVATGVVTLLFGVALLRYIQRETLYPIRKMTDVMTRIDRGEIDLRITSEFHTLEFSQVKDSFNRLMDEIMDLKIEGYEKLIELKDMELRSIRLQIHPHFFLNAISTISSLSGQQRNQEIKTYVDALSKNIRYMFKSGLHTVTVGEEIRHIENYFAMQECKYPGCAFYFIDMPPALEEWRIPQMLIQTFIENEYKYAVSMDGVLTIFIRVSKKERNGEEMLQICIEDDGKGYPQEVLCYMNGHGKRGASDGSRVGLWSIKRTMELMYEREDLIELSNILPHGCMNRIWVPKEPLHEFVQERQPWQG